jgi:hypothetical protein
METGRHGPSSAKGLDIADGLFYGSSARKGDPGKIKRIHWEGLSMLSSEAVRLKAMIDKAIEDHQITTTEYEKILALANADMKIDPQERQLLAQLQELLTSGAVKRVPG